MDALLTLHASSHLLQKSFKRTTPPHGCNGVVPVSSCHASLCATRTALGLSHGQIVQIGHWTSCSAVYPDALAIGNPWRPSFLDRARVVCTALVPESERLVMVCRRPYASVLGYSSERHRAREDLVWFQVAVQAEWLTLHEAVQQNLVTQSGIAYSWAASDVLVKQAPCHAPKTVAWHLVFDVPVFTTSPRPSEYFAWRDRDYWAHNVDDIHSPANRLELKAGKQDVCSECSS